MVGSFFVTSCWGFADEGDDEDEEAEVEGEVEDDVEDDAGDGVGAPAPKARSTPAASQTTLTTSVTSPSVGALTTQVTLPKPRDFPGVVPLWFWPAAAPQAATCTAQRLCLCTSASACAPPPPPPGSRLLVAAT